MTDAYSVTEDIPAVPEKTAVPTNRIFTPVPRELRQFFLKVREAVRNSQTGLRFKKLAARKPH